MMGKIWAGLCVLAAAFVVSAAADELAPPAPPITFEKQIMIDTEEGGPGAPGPGSFVFISSEFGGENKTVKGAPYSAESVTERTQVLEDGNHIVQKNTAQIYRDSEGRTRREQQFGAIGPFAPSTEPHISIMIHDPVKGEHYILEPDEQVARKMPANLRGPLPPHPPHVRPPAPPDPKMVDGESEDVLVAPAPPHEMRQVFTYFSKPADGNTESLGKQTMEGVEVEGTRVNTTIPEGQIGNERAIQIVTEKWYSPELQVNVMTRHTDPRFGTTTYLLRNINRGEPDKSLFQIPAGYKIEDAPAGDRVFIKKKIITPPKP